MTKAEKLIELGLHITLSREEDGKLQEDYVAEFKPGYINPLQIQEKKGGHYLPVVSLSLESAVELAEFLKHLFLDEDTN